MTDNHLSEADPLGAIADEFVEAFRQGKRPSVEEFARRYPAHADAIRDVLPALVLMEKAKPEGDASSGAGPPAAPLRQLGDYQILRKVGRGGMGVVYEAVQLSLGRHVALKVLAAHALLDPRQLGRFQREARSAARLHHTNIVPVFGVGEHEGLHYYVMQFIHGLSLDTVLDELRCLRQINDGAARTAARTLSELTRDVSAAQVAHGLLTGEFSPTCAPDTPSAFDAPALEPRRQAAVASRSESVIHLPGQPEASSLTEVGRQYWVSVARVGVQVADALAYAAAQGVLHRDIKPSNLLLDGQGNVWVTDFGLAKGDADADDLTHTGDIVGTLRYLAPERFSGQGDLRSDLYALGLTLYEMLTRRPAFDESDRNRLVREVMHGEPPRPRKVNPAVPRDLETVVLKSIARDPAHRYQTATAMADDLKRFVEDRPVKARRAGVLERGWRWCRRNPALALLALGLLLSLVGGLAGVSWKWWEARGHLAEADRQRREADHQRGIAREEAERTRYLLYITNMQLAAQVWDSEEGTARAVSDLLAQHLPQPGERDLRDFLWRYQWSLLRRNTVPLPRAARAAAVWGAAFSPDGQLVYLGDDRRLRSWDLQHRREAHALALPYADKSWRVGLSPDTRTVAVATGDGTVRLLDRASGREHHVLRAAAPGPVSLTFLPDGKTLLTRARDGPGKTWDVATGRELETVPALPPDLAGVRSGRPRPSALSPDGKTLAVARGQAGRVVTLLDWRTGARLVESPRHPTSVHALAWSPDGKVLATGDSAGRVVLWEVPAMKPLGKALHSTSSYMVALAFSPDGGRLAAGSDHGLVVVWDMASRKRLCRWKGHSDRVSWLAFRADGQALVSGSADQTVRLWDLNAPAEGRVFAKPGTTVFDIAYPPDGAWLAAAEGGVARLYEARAGRLVHTLRGHGEPTGAGEDRIIRVTRLAFAPGGGTLATGGNDSRVMLWDVASGRLQATLEGRPADWAAIGSQTVGCLAFSPDGSLLAAGYGAPTFHPAVAYDQVVKVWEVGTRREIRALRGHRCNVSSLMFSGDGKTLVAASSDRTLRSWEVGRWTEVRTLTLPERLSAMAVAPDGGTLATGSLDGSVTLRDPGTWEEKHTFRAHAHAVARLAFSSDGRTLASGSWDRTVRLWDVASGREMRVLKGHAALVQSLAFSPDGSALATGGWDGALRLWQAASPEEIAAAPKE
jgi:WD40 repeat protein/serine/threonine protein kinase